MAATCSTLDAGKRHWSEDCMIYHIYPLGLVNAPSKNKLSDPPVDTLQSLTPWLVHAKELGMNAVYLGPIFQSMSHGYNTVDYNQIDRRLGDKAAFKSFVLQAHGLGLRVILDAVFGHVGRDFPPFQHLRELGRESSFVDWFRAVDFSKFNHFGDPFSYEYWQNATDLPRLNLGNDEVRNHLFAAIDGWISDFDIDGLRLDTADVLDFEFLDALRRHCEEVRPGFWLMGEVVHGDYRNWTQEGRLHSVTNYHAYNAMTSLKIGDIAQILRSQYGEGGSHQDQALYNFLDNHDVDRIASKAGGREYLFPLYCLLFSMPGIPSIYYGGEWGLSGKRTDTSDTMLRPALDLKDMQNVQSPDLPEALRMLTRLRSECAALRQGTYRQVALGDAHLVFRRDVAGETVLVAVNFGDQAVEISHSLKGCFESKLVDLLNPCDRIEAPGPCRKVLVPPRWARVLKAV